LSSSLNRDMHLKGMGVKDTSQTNFQVIEHTMKTFLCYNRLIVRCSAPVWNLSAITCRAYWKINKEGTLFNTSCIMYIHSCIKKIAGTANEYELQFHQATTYGNTVTRLILMVKPIRQYIGSNASSQPLHSNSYSNLNWTLYIFKKGK